MGNPVSGKEIAHPKHLILYHLPLAPIVTSNGNPTKFGDGLQGKILPATDSESPLSSSGYGYKIIDSGEVDARYEVCQTPI
jgi:hypothetical protein